ncbi:hypothetical protein [Streptomyces anulatus]|uniref:hypothetical protein n=1 Tax=Streptomyces anulatus TaxID=1892 RepID=UPI003F4A794B
MARIRSIKPELRTSITVSMWPREVRYFFILLWGYFDDYGRGVDDELLIASDCFPRDRDVTSEVVDGWLETIAESGPLCRYEVDGRNYLHAPNWREHQKPSHPTRSKIPPCPDDEPDDFKRWREVNPQRLRSRSRKSREALQKIPATPPEASRASSGGPSDRPVEASAWDVEAQEPVDTDEALIVDEDAGQSPISGSPEMLRSDSGNAPEHFAPEQGSKGAREQGSEGARGCGGEGDPRRPRADLASPERPHGLAPIDADGFALTDTMRRWVGATYPGFDIEHATAQFISHYRSTGARRKSWPDAWQKWIRDDAKKAAGRQQRYSSNVVQLPSGQTLSGTDATVAGWADLAASLDDDEESA